MAKRLKNFNEEFSKQYDGSSLITKFDVDEKAHVELGPQLGDAIFQAKKVRDKMKDDFKEQDELVTEFLKAQDLKEKPEFPDVDNKAVLKSMKLAENMLKESDLKDEEAMKNTCRDCAYLVDDDNGGWYCENYDAPCLDVFDRCENSGESFKENCSNKKSKKKSLQEMMDYDEWVSHELSFDEWVEDRTGKWPSELSQDELSRLEDEYNENMQYDYQEYVNDYYIDESLLNESFAGFDGVYDFIDCCVPMEKLGEMAYKWLSSDELEDMLVANGYDPEDDLLEEILSSPDSELKKNLNEATGLERDADIVRFLSTYPRRDDFVKIFNKVTDSPLFKGFFEKIKKRFDAGKRTNVKAITEPIKLFSYLISSVILGDNVLKNECIDRLERVMINNDVEDSVFNRDKILDFITYCNSHDYEVKSKLNESVQSLTEDYANFIGRPLKDFLKTIRDTNPAVNLDYESTDEGCSGLSGRVSDVPWSVADRIIKDIQLGDERYYKFKIITEAATEINEAGKVSRLPRDKKDDTHRYKVVASDEDDNALWVRDVKGIDSAKKKLDELTDDKIKELGATQVYIVRDDEKEIYYKSSDEDGTWEVVQDNIDMERPAEERDTLFNHIQADLSAESTPDIKVLRKMDRSGQGYVGFEDDEIGFHDNTFFLKSKSDAPIEWAKKVADYYGFEVSNVDLGTDGYKYIQIYTPGLEDDPKLVP